MTITVVLLLESLVNYLRLCLHQPPESPAPFESLRPTLIPSQLYLWIPAVFADFVWHVAAADDGDALDAAVLEPAVCVPQMMASEMRQVYSPAL